jgi:hypothetical protein
MHFHQRIAILPDCHYDMFTGTKGAFGRASASVVAAPAVAVLVERILWGAESVLGKHLAKQLLLIVKYG